jgi:hypothetical protein
MRYIRGVISRADTPESEGAPIRFVASTEGVARDGLEIGMDAWNLDNYRRNPVVLWAHDYSGQRPPIGRADVFVDGDRLMADVTFDQSDDFARSIEAKYRGGFLHSVSVGWDTQAMEPSPVAGSRGRVTRADLLDISAVPVPGDPNALIARQARALAAIAEAVDVPATTPEPTTAGWSGTAAEMVALYRDTAQGRGYDVADRYRHLARAYDRAGKIAPEYLEPEALEALGVEGVRALFLEGEPDMFPDAFESRAGAVLSRENLADLQDAVNAIQRVIERGMKAKSGDYDEDDMTPRAAEAAVVETPDEVLTRILSAIKES